MRPAHLVLGVPADAPEKEVRRAYRRLAKELHPDRAAPADRAEAHARFLELRAAYDQLMSKASASVASEPKRDQGGGVRPSGSRRQPTTDGQGAPQPRPADRGAARWPLVLGMAALCALLGTGACLIALHVLQSPAQGVQPSREEAGPKAEATEDGQQGLAAALERAPKALETERGLVPGAAGVGVTMATGDVNKGIDAYETLRPGDLGSDQSAQVPSAVDKDQLRQQALDLLRHRGRLDEYARMYGRTEADARDLWQRCDRAGKKTLEDRDLPYDEKALRSDIQPVVTYRDGAGAWQEETSVYFDGFTQALNRATRIGTPKGGTDPQ